MIAALVLGHPPKSAPNRGVRHFGTQGNTQTPYLWAETPPFTPD